MLNFAAVVFNQALNFAYNSPLVVNHDVEDDEDPGAELPWASEGQWRRLLQLTNIICFQTLGGLAGLQSPFRSGKLAVQIESSYSPEFINLLRYSRSGVCVVLLLAI